MANNIPTGPAPSASAPTTPARTPESNLEELKASIKKFQFYTDLGNIPGPIGGFFKKLDEAAKENRDTLRKL